MPDKVERDGQTACRLVSPGEFHASRHLPGAVFPNYELSDDTGKHRQLSELKGPDPMILVFSRGGFCPKNRRRAETSDQNPLRIDIFVRCGTQGAEDLEIAEHTDPAHDPIIPHIIVLEPGLMVFKIYLGYCCFGRPTIKELGQDLMAISRKCRPDWDITSPEMKAAWERGERARFYPYSKS